MEGEMPVPAKKKVGIAGYVSPQSRKPVTRRIKSATDDILTRRAINKIPASKRAKAQAKDANPGH